MPCGAFLTQYWVPCGFCNRPLRYWMIVNCGLQMLQAPIRFVFALRLCQTQRRHGDVQECIRSLTHSSAWRLSKSLSILIYCWFVMGVIWLMNSNYCRACPELYRLTLAVIITAGVRVLLTVCVFHRLFPRRGDGGAQAQPEPRGASQEVIDRLPVIQYIPDVAGGSKEPCCAVCLNDFKLGDKLRELPCSHRFHMSCIDEWLRRRKTCPLCLHDVEALPPARRKSVQRKDKGS